MPLEKKSLKDLKIPSTAIGAVGGLGEVSLRRASVQVFSDILKAENDSKLDDADLVTALIAGLSYKGGLIRPTPDDVQKLGPADRQKLVDGIIGLHPEWFYPGADPDGETDHARRLDRREGESHEAYLARGFRSEASEFHARAAKLLSGSSDRMKSILGNGLTVNIGASMRVSDLIATMKQPQLHLSAPTVDKIAALELPTLAPHPTHKTNEILTDVAGQIGQMRELATATAEMQRSLNDTASAAVVDFSTGAEASRAATKNGLWIAGASLLVSAIALVATLYFSIRQDTQTALREQAAQEQTAKLLASETALAGALLKVQSELLSLKQFTSSRMVGEIPQGIRRAGRGSAERRHSQP